MSYRIIKIYITLALCCWVGVLPSKAQFGIDWTGLATSVIDEGARSEVQKVFRSLSTVKFSDAKLNIYRKQAEKVGLTKPTPVNALILFEQGIRALEVSPFPILTNQKMSVLGGGVFRDLGNSMQEGIRKDLTKVELSDFLSAATMYQLSQIDLDGALGMLLSKRMTSQFALLLDNQPECLHVLKQHPELLEFGHIEILPYFVSKATSHSDRFKKGAISDISNWDFSMQDNESLLVSSQSGEIGRVKRSDNQLLIDITGDPQWLNCNLPASATINYGSTSLTTDKLGRVVKVNFLPLKVKFKDSYKRQLKSKDILKAKDEYERKDFMIIPKKYGGMTTWNNVIAYSKTKENKQNLKALDKRLSELEKLGDISVSVKISYSSTSDTPSMVQYYCDEELICTLK